MADLIQSLEARGFRKEFQGGNCYCMQRDGASRTIIITSEFDADLPEWDSWYVGIYDKSGEYWTESKLVDNLDSSNSPCGILSAIDNINDDDAIAECARNGHRDDGRGCCVDCGEFI